MKQELFFVCEVCGEANTNQEYIAAHENLCLRQKEREVTRRKSREDSGQLTIKQIIEKCKYLPNLPVIIAYTEENANQNNYNYSGLYPCRTSSYRGSYYELSIEPGQNIIYLSNFIEMMNDSLISSYFGYKGGEYFMNHDTFVWVAEYGICTKLAVTDLKFCNITNTIKLFIKQLN